MSAVAQVTKGGPRTYTPAEQILGGQLVEGRAASRIGVAAAGSVKVLGVALTDAINPEAVVTTPVTTAGRPVLNAAAFPVRVAVAYAGDEVKVTYTAAAAFGDALQAAALGQVTPVTVATADARSIVGRCTEPAGVAAGAVGLMRIA